MTEQTIPAEKVRELAAKYSGDVPTDPHFLLSEIKADLRALLPAQQPTTGLLGRWAKHEEYGDVVCTWDRPNPEGNIHVRWVDESFPLATGRYYVPLSDLTFPEQATKPEDVPVGEAWLVDVEDSEESHKSIVALKYACDDWRTSDGVTNCSFWEDTEVTLISPLTPERPGKDDEGFLAENERIFAAYSECAEALQARYDELDKSWCYLDGKYSTLREDYDALEAKYREAQEKIEALSQDITPHTVTTEHEYAALPVRSVVAEPRGETWEKTGVGIWSTTSQGPLSTNDQLAGTARTVLRYGWGDEHPAWRIEHDPDNLRVGEYIIDKDGDTGTVTYRFGSTEWATDGDARGTDDYAPFIAFLNRDAATPEAIEEAMKARDKEMGK